MWIDTLDAVAECVTNLPGWSVGRFATRTSNREYSLSQAPGKPLDAELRRRRSRVPLASDAVTIGIEVVNIPGTLTATQIEARLRLFLGTEVAAVIDVAETTAVGGGSLVRSARRRRARKKARGKSHYATCPPE